MSDHVITRTIQDQWRTVARSPEEWFETGSRIGPALDELLVIVTSYQPWTPQPTTHFAYNHKPTRISRAGYYGTLIRNLTQAVCLRAVEMTWLRCSDEDSDGIPFATGLFADRADIFAAAVRDLGTRGLVDLCQEAPCHLAGKSGLTDQDIADACTQVEIVTAWGHIARVIPAAIAEIAPAVAA